jgi:hypothetical protein
LFLFFSSSSSLFSILSLFSFFLSLFFSSSFLIFWFLLSSSYSATVPYGPWLPVQPYSLPVPGQCLPVC